MENFWLFKMIDKLPQPLRIMVQIPLWIGAYILFYSYWWVKIGLEVLIFGKEKTRAKYMK